MEEQLQSIITNWDADLVSGIIINPKDGSIYSMASLPNFNLNDFSEVKNPLLFSNPSVENVFELGSIIDLSTSNSSDKNSFTVLIISSLVIYLNFFIIKLEFVPPNPKEFDKKQFKFCCFVSAIILIFAVISSGFSKFMLGAMKLFFIINIE